jgi:tape measure domain-containing protein
MSLAGAIRAGRAFISLGLDDRELRTALRRMRGRLQSLGRAVGNVGAGLIAAGGGIMGALAWPVKLAANLELTHAAFTTMLKDGDAAQALLDRLQAFAASTPFQFPELADAARSLLAFGGSSETVTDELRMLGDIASGINAPIGEIATLFGKIRVDGRVMSEDLNQLGGRGIPILETLAEVMGVNAQEVRKLASEGKIGFAEVQQAFGLLTAEGGLFAGGMERASKTLSGLWSTLLDNVAQAVLPIGQELLPMLGQAANVFTQLSKIVGAFLTQNKGLATAIAGVALGLVSIGGTLFAVGGGLYLMTLAASGLAAGFGIVLATFSALAGVVSALAVPIAAVVAIVAALRTSGVDLGQAWRAAIGGLGDLFQPIADIAGQITETLGKDFTAASQTVIGAWEAVVSALGRGDAQAAIEIVTAALEVAWLQATESISRYWSDLVGGIRDRWTDAITYVSKLGVTLVTVLQNAFGTIRAYIVGIVDSIITRIAQAIAYMSGLVTGSGREAVDLLGRELEQRANARADGLTKQLETNSNAAADYFNTLDAMAKEEKAARNRGRGEAVAAAERRLLEAQGRLAEIQAQEKQAADKAAEDKKKNQPDIPGEAGKTARAIGAFSAAVLARQTTAVDSVAKRTAKATEQTAANTQKLVDKNQGLLFA